MTDWLNRCHFGDVRDVLRQMAAAGVKVNCIVTSPPYKCTPMDAPRVAGAMRKWVKEQGTGAIVRAVRRYPADGLGRVWMLKPERAGT